MSAPFIWIVLPLIVSILLVIFQQRKTIVLSSALAASVLLAWLAWQLPLGKTIILKLGVANPSFLVSESITALGQLFILSDQSRPALLVIYLTISIWFVAASFIKKERLFLPLGLGAASFLSAAIALQPHLYAIIFVELAVFFCIPILAPPGKPTAKGVISFLIFQTLGMCFILFSNWSLTHVDATTTIIPSLFSLFLGLAMVLAIFPFHSWIATLAEECHPLPTGLIFFLIPTVILFILVHTVNRFILLGFSEELFSLLRISGLIMVISGGLWAFFEDHLARMMGFGVILQIGMILIAISLFEGEQRASALNGLYFAQIAVMAITLALSSLALSLIREHKKGLSFKATRSSFYQLPLAGSALILASLSLGGLPLLASFPVFITLWTSLAREHLPIAQFSLLGNALFLAASLRVLHNLTDTQQKLDWSSEEPKIAVVLLVIGITSLFLIGTLPGRFLPIWIQMGIIFLSLGQ